MDAGADRADVRTRTVGRVAGTDQGAVLSRRVRVTVEREDLRDAHRAGLDVLVRERELLRDRPLELRISLLIDLAAARDVVQSEPGVLPFRLAGHRQQVIPRRLRGGVPEQ